MEGSNMAVVTPTPGNHCIGTFLNGDVDRRLKCKKSDGTNTCATWRYFTVSCGKVNSQCSTTSGAFVGASVVCSQNLW